MTQKYKLLVKEEVLPELFAGFDIEYIEDGILYQRIPGWRNSSTISKRFLVS